MLTEGKLTEGHARAILGLESEERMIQMAERIVNDSLSVREAESARPRKKRRRLQVKRVSPVLAEMESELKRMLATSVKIHPGLKRGKIEIEYYGDEDLTRLWELFRKIEQ